MRGRIACQVARVEVSLIPKRLARRNHMPGASVQMVLGGPEYYASC